MSYHEKIYGRRPVLEYIKAISSYEGVELFISKTAHGKIIETIIREAKKNGVKPQLLDGGALSKQSPSSKHQGVILITHHKTNAVSDSDFLEHVKEKNGVLVLLDQITDPHNAGSIIRTTEALGGHGIILPKSRSVDITPAVAKSSSGATAHIRIITISSVANFLDRIRSMGFWIIGASHDGDSDISKLRDLKPAVIIIGSEGKGMRRLTKKKCDYIVRIPLKGQITSLNASVAAGILLYEALKE